MKKEYSKPNILIEDFSLIENISMSGCGFEIHNHYKSSCSYNASGDVTEEDKEIMENDFTNIFYSMACRTIINDDFNVDCLNGFMSVFSS